MTVVMPSRLDVGDDLLDLLDDHRREPLIGLVEEQQLELARQRPGDRQHLLLAAGKRRRLLPPPLGEAREVPVDALQRPADRLGDLREDQVLLDGQAADDAAVLRHELDAGARRLDTPSAGGSACRRARSRPASAPGCRRARCARSVEVLPAPLRPSSARISPSLHLEARRPARCSSRRSRRGCRGTRRRRRRAAERRLPAGRPRRSSRRRSDIVIGGAVPR